MDKALPPRDDVDRQYVLGKGERGQTNIVDSINASIQ